MNGGISQCEAPRFYLQFPRNKEKKDFYENDKISTIGDKQQIKYAQMPHYENTGV